MNVHILTFYMLWSNSCCSVQTDPVLMSLKEGFHRPNQLVFKAPVKEKKSVVVNGIDLLENVPPRTENEVRKEFAAAFISRINQDGTFPSSSPLR